MRLLSAPVVLAAAVLAAAIPADAATPRDTLLVSAAWLAQHASDPQLVILHVGPNQSYDDGHIPGARFVDFSELCPDDAASGNSLQMPAADELRLKLAALGISNTSRVVVYFAKGWLTPATRVVFTLDYAGLDNVVLLDGGAGAWTAAGKTLTKDVPPAAAGTLAPLTLKPIVVDAAFVKAHVNTPGYAIVDARSGSFYDGVQAGGMAEHRHRSGHIPSALNVPVQSVASDAAGQVAILSDPDLAALFTKAGVKPGDTIVGYCHIGQFATGMLFAARLAGYKVLLYDGSFEDWSRHADYPVDNPSAKKH